MWLGKLVRKFESSSLRQKNRQVSPCRFFLSKPQGWYIIAVRSAAYIISPLGCISSRIACIFLRLDDIPQHVADDIHACGVNKNESSTHAYTLKDVAIHFSQPKNTSDCEIVIVEYYFPLRFSKKRLTFPELLHIIIMDLESGSVHLERFQPASTERGCGFFLLKNTWLPFLFMLLYEWSSAWEEHHYPQGSMQVRLKYRAPPAMCGIGIGG